MKPAALLLSALILALASCSKPLGPTQAVGACPACEREVIGTMLEWHGFLPNGKEIQGKQYEAKCGCGASLICEDKRDPETARVQWNVVCMPENADDKPDTGTQTPQDPT